MGRYCKYLMFIAVFLIAIPNAYAGLIIDTGAGASEGGALVLDRNQWWAGKFTFTDHYKITDINAWLVSSYYGNLTFAIYNDAGTAPGSGLINSATILRTFNYSNNAPAWDGPSGLNWDLSAGTYWLALEVTDGYGGGLLYAVPSPLAAYDYKHTGGEWTPYASYFFGVRIYGETQVPEPATAILLGFGLVGLAGISRRLLI